MSQSELRNVTFIRPKPYPPHRRWQVIGRMPSQATVSKCEARLVGPNLVSIGVLLLACLSVEVAWAQSEPTATEVPTAGESLPAPLQVEVVPVQIRPGTQVLSLTGEIEARDARRAAFPVGGRIAAVLVSEGDSVRSGDELARLEQVRQEQSLRAAEAGLATAQADLVQANNDFARQDELLERGATTRVVRDDAERTLRAAEATAAEAQARLDLAREALSDTVLLAPADAIVTLRDAEVGQVVGAAETVIELAIGAEYDAVFNVPEVMLTVPREAPVVDLELIDVVAPPFKGAAREISPLIDPELGTVQVKIGVIDPPEGIAFGASVRGTVRREEAPSAALPFSALTATAEGPAVWVVDPLSQSVSLRKVQVLRHESGQALVVDGLKEGEQVVARGGQLMFPGRQVHAVVAKDSAEWANE